MFTAIPCPIVKWGEESRPIMTLFLPAVGAILGGLWTLTAYLLRLSGLPPLVRGFLLCAFPLAVTGGIHMDGFLDTVDAVRSWRSLEERRRILKDPHAGSFAVIAACLLILAQFALFASAKETANLFSLLFIPLVTRASAALCVTVLRPISESQYSGAYRKGVKSSHALFLSLVLLGSIALGFAVLGRYGLAPLASLAGYCLSLRRGVRSLEGMSGDLSGYALTWGELCGIAVYALL